MPIAYLDYKSAQLSMEVTNQVEAKYRLVSCSKEPWTVEFIEAIPAGAVLWDIGANTGAYSLIAAYRNLTTIAIEPGFNNYAALCRNLAMNNLLDRCVTLCVALDAQSGFKWLDYADMRQGAASHMLGALRKQYFHRQLVPIFSWDELMTRIPLPPDRPQYAKIDVDDCNELLVLQGASRWLRDERARGIIVEMNDPQQDTIINVLIEAGWQLTARYNNHNGVPIPDMSYGRFERG